VQAPVLRVPLAGGTRVATPEAPSEDLIPSLLTLSDVMGTGWFAAEAPNLSDRGPATVALADSHNLWNPSTLAINSRSPWLALH
jgi:hypothetical protein